jgi:undecaprenyl-diphosphatase
MNLLNAIFLGFIQGMAEFLPISSSGHLVIIQSLLPNFTQPGVLFDVILHFGTLMAILYFFRKKLLSYININYLTLLIIGTIPAVLLGLLFKDSIEALFKSTKLVGVALLATGALNLFVDRLKTKTDKITNKNSLIIGIFQAVAIIPGISRSGSTIFASVAQKINKANAAEFSFILSIPAVLGANFLEIASHPSGLETNPIQYLLGFLSAFFFGVLAIRLVFKVITTKHFEYFAYYCFVVGVLTLLFTY